MNALQDDLLRVRDAQGSERHTLLAGIANKLATKYLRSRDAEHEETTRVLTVLAHFAEKQPGAFGWGEPSKIGTTVLGLVEQLAVDSEDHQRSVLSALSSVLQLLCVGCARTFSCFSREALALLSVVGRLRSAESLDWQGRGESAGTNADPNGSGFSGSAFAEFARYCGEAIAPAHIQANASERTWLQSGLLMMCAELHATAPQFVGDGGPMLWEAVLNWLGVRTLPLLPPPIRLTPLRALRQLLQQLEVPTPLRGRLLHRLLLLLCCGASPAQLPTAQLEDEAMADVCASAPLPHFRSPECDELIGECLERLADSALSPPIASLPVLQCAVPWALTASTSGRLHAVLCRLLCALPIEALAPQLLILERFLSVRSLQRALLPCYEAALTQRPPTTDGDADGTEAAAGLTRGLRLAPPSLGNQGGEGDLQDDVNDAHAAKRARRGGAGAGGAQSATSDAGIVEGVRRRLCERAMELQMCDDMEADISSLSTLGAITCLLLRARARRPATTDGARGDTPLEGPVAPLVYR